MRKTKWMTRLLNAKNGATMTEYTVIAAVVILVAVIAFTSLGATILAKIFNLVSVMFGGTR